MSRHMGVEEARKSLGHLVREIQASGEAVTLTIGNSRTPVARITPLEDPVGNHINIDYDALNELPEHERYGAAGGAIEQAAAYRDAVVAEMVDCYTMGGIPEVARRLELQVDQVEDHVRRHRERHGLVKEKEFLGLVIADQGEYWAAVHEAEDGHPVFPAKGQDWPTGFREGADIDDVLEKAQDILEQHGWDPQPGGWRDGQDEGVESYHLDVEDQRPDRHTPEAS